MPWVPWELQINPTNFPRFHKENHQAVGISLNRLNIFPYNVQFQE
jgi:hypothetical protein